VPPAPREKLDLPGVYFKFKWAYINVSQGRFDTNVLEACEGPHPFCLVLALQFELETVQLSKARHGQQRHDTSGCHFESLYDVGIYASRYCRSIPGYVLRICRYTSSAFSTQYQARVDLKILISTYTLQAYTWDWLMSMPEEYRIIRKVGFKLPNIAYFVSRLVMYNNDDLRVFSCSSSLSVRLDSALLVLACRPLSSEVIAYHISV
jgi:hypothetical protein